MTSTFGLLNSAYSGLAAAKAALDTTGQNIANASTAGYTRQRVDQTSVGAVNNIRIRSLGGASPDAGEGVQVTGIARLNDVVATAQVRTTAASSGYWSTMSSAASTVESSLNEPGASGLTETLSGFWSAWQTMGNDAGSSQTAPSAAKALIGSGTQLAATIAANYQSAANAWSSARGTATTTVQQLNSTLAQVADLNGRIRAGQAEGANVNDLLDARDTALTTLSTEAGTTTRSNADGTLDVVLGGRTVVTGTTARSLTLQGATDVSGAAGQPVHLALDDGTTISPDGGVLAGALTTLAPASNGSGGVYAEAAAQANQMAVALASQVNNALTAAGATTPSGSAAPFFGFTSANGPAATNLTVIPTSVDGVAAAGGTAGTAGYSVGGAADAVAQLGTTNGSPDSMWATYVAGVGLQAKNATAQSTLASTASTNATAAQTSSSGVDLDEETANLVVFQHAYQAAARVLTTVDQMLDTLINNTGLVGRS